MSVQVKKRNTAESTWMQKKGENNAKKFSFLKVCTVKTSRIGVDIRGGERGGRLGPPLFQGYREGPLWELRT